MLHWTFDIAGGLVIYMLGHLVGWHAGWKYGFRDCWRAGASVETDMHSEDANANRKPLIQEGGNDSHLEPGGKIGTVTCA